MRRNETRAPPLTPVNYELAIYRRALVTLDSAAAFITRLLLAVRKQANCVYMILRVTRSSHNPFICEQTIVDKI